MDFSKLAATRQSVREYRPDRVPREAIERCLEAARLAPSACNSQPWKFVVVDDPELVRKVAAATISGPIRFNKFAETAPVIIVVVREPSKAEAVAGGAARNVPYAYIDIGIAVEHFCLAAAEQGLGTCILGWLVDARMKRILSVPANRKIALAITVGYPASDRIRQKDRKSLDAIRSYNRYTGEDRG
jgi:nitroreductase